MKPIVTLSIAVALVASLAGSAVQAATRQPVLQPDKLLVLSTTDVKGKTGPCGCHVPKGGMSRRASFVDSLRLSYGQLVLVDNGGFFPDENERKAAPAFMLDVMKTMGTDAVNIGERDLRFGREFLAEKLTRSGIPAVSANLVDKASQKPLFNPYIVKKVGGVTVGIFGLIAPTSDLGPSKESLAVLDPSATARTAVAALKAKGAQVIILLAQLGKVDGEDLVTEVDGIDAVMMGRNVALIQRGRMVKSTIACYGGEQGHYVCRTELALDAQHHMQSAEAEAVILGPEVPDNAPIAASVKAFEASVAPAATPAATPAAAPAPAAADTSYTPKGSAGR